MGQILLSIGSTEFLDGRIHGENVMLHKTVIPRGTKLRRINLSRKTAPCLRCGQISKRHSIGTRHLREVGISAPVILEVIYSKHYCTKCRKHFSLPMEHLAQPSGRFTNRVRRTAMGMVLDLSMTLEKASQRMRQKYYVHVPATTLHEWCSMETKLD